MRMKKMHRSLAILLSLTLCFTFVLLGFDVKALAAGDDDTVVVVSFGDSYSSGEALGVEADLQGGGHGSFYGYTGNVKKDFNSDDWLAHRSTVSWPSRLVIPGVDGKLGDYHVPDSGNAVCKWYFVAVSGAETKHVRNTTQEKKVRKINLSNGYFSKKRDLPVQTDVFNQISEPVDYVTMTIGGNDVDFVGVLTAAATSFKYLQPNKLEDKFDDLWAGIETHKTNITETYNLISQSAGSQAKIIIAGYPELIYKDGSGFLFSEKDARLINKNVRKFNKVLKGLVEDCSNNGMNIYFVDVESAFKDHQAYAPDEYINGFIALSKEDDLDCLSLFSGYSFHPNDKGAQAYADCVNAVIQNIAEEEKAKAEYSIVLNWGENPSDLDAHLEGARSDGTPFHASFREPVIFDGADAICKLDVDKMMRHGPETITLSTKKGKPYYYYVHRYRGAGSLQTSEATVEIYKDGTLIETIAVTTDDSVEGNYWNVFAIDNGDIVIQNTITAEADTDYANY